MVTWNDEANAKLLRSILKKVKLSKQDYADIAEDMGDGCTPKAIINRLARMQGKWDESSPATPRKNGTAAPARTPASGKGKNGAGEAKRKRAPKVKKQESDDETDGGAEGDVEATPVKKMKVQSDDDYEA